MRLKNISTSVLSIHKVKPVPGSPLLQDVLLNPNDEVLLFNEIVEQIKEVGDLITAGFLSRISDEEPLDSAPTNDEAKTYRYSGVDSFQPGAYDLILEAAAGSADGGDPSFLGPIMGNLLNDVPLTKDANYLGGVIGHYSLTGAKATTYPAGAVLAGIGDGVTEADGAVVAYVDGDSAITKAGAAFKVKSNNSTAASGFDFGLDLQDPAHDGYLPVDSAFYKKGIMRLTEGVCVVLNNGVPVDGVSGTGAGVTGKGSLLVDFTNGTLYQNTGTTASPTWTAR